MWLFQSMKKPSLTLVLTHFLHLSCTDLKYSLVWEVLARDSLMPLGGLALQSIPTVETVGDCQF